MFFINLDSLEKINLLTKVCDNYSADIDIEYGRYIVNAKSILAVTSLMGHIVRININTEDSLMKQYLYRDLQEIGGWIQD